jgi:hypothetical protein
MPIYFRLSLKAVNGLFYSGPKYVLAKDKEEALTLINRKYRKSGQWTGFSFIKGMC